APGAPAPPPPPPISESGMGEYKYPKAKLDYSVRGFGNESMTMTTSDSVSEVKDYYQKRLGPPMVEDENNETAIFQVNGSPMVVITINQDPNDSDKTQITIVRSKLIPKIN